MNSSACSGVNTVVEYGTDIHARLVESGTDWYGRMRTHSIQTVHEIKLERKVTEINVKHKEYMDLLQCSKICFSPFEFGEACRRSYEAVVGGAF